jgi:hypothetical protein
MKPEPLVVTDLHAEVIEGMLRLIPRTYRRMRHCIERSQVSAESCTRTRSTQWLGRKPDKRLRASVHVLPRQVVRPLLELKKSIDHAAAGNLEIRCSRKGEKYSFIPN